MLRADTVTQSTLELLKNIQQIPLFQELRLVGGTALALQLGHRISVDLDFFGNLETDTDIVLDELKSNGFEIIPHKISKNIKIFTINDVKVDFVNYQYKWLDDAIIDESVTMAGLKDIAAMKLNAVSGRGTKKDFVDIYFLLKYFSLTEMMTLFEEKYHDGSSFLVTKSLNYFGDAEKDAMPKMLIPVDWEEIKTTIKKAVESID